MDEEELRFAAQAIREADSAVAMTGAGVSTASGVPDFRGDDGLWETHDPADFHISRFEASPGEFWRDRLDLHADIRGDAAIEPNAAHDALTALESRGDLESVITQNIDGLHRAAGTEAVIELHGSGERVVCRDCGRRVAAGPVRERVREGETPPHCAECGGVLKPDVVLFGESLPEHALLKSHALAEKADVFLVAGSSLAVEPAASLPKTAADHGATIIVVNLDRTPLSDRAEYDFRADVTDVLPRLSAAVAAGQTGSTRP
jgi:NAD-dependent deacetylase